MTISHLQILYENVIKEVKLSFQFVFNTSIINKILDSIVAPYGIACQNTINELIEIILKYQSTHNLSID